MKRILSLIILPLVIVSCHDHGREKSGVSNPPLPVTPEGSILIARDMVTEVILRPDPEGDPWDIEKVAGYQGVEMVDDIFKKIYKGSIVVYDYHTGEKMSPAEVRKIESEFNNDRSRIGKLSFIEDWYYFPADSHIEKRCKSVVFGYELYNNFGKVYAYRAAFRADLGN